MGLRRKGMFSKELKARQKEWRVHLLSQRDPVTNEKIIGALVREIRKLRV